MPRRPLELLSKQEFSLCCLSLVPFCLPFTLLLDSCFLSSMSDKELNPDDVSVDESRASPDEKSDIVVQDEDACTPLPEGLMRNNFSNITALVY